MKATSLLGYALTTLLLAACQKGNSTQPPGSTVGPTGAPAADARNAKLVGVWELLRYDNIPPSEMPPGGMATLVYVFHPDGRLRFYMPGAEDEPYGRGNTPFDKFIPYTLDGEHFNAWMGLTNDLKSQNTLRLASPGSAEVTFPDGSVASLVRRSTDPTKPPTLPLRCVPFTIAGTSYDPAFVAKLEQKASKEPNEPVRKAMLGQWFIALDENTSKPTAFDIMADGSFQRTEFMDGEPYANGGAYELHDDAVRLTSEDGCDEYIVVLETNRMRFVAPLGRELIFSRDATAALAAPALPGIRCTLSLANDSDEDLTDVGVDLGSHDVGNVSAQSSSSTTGRFVLPKTVTAHWTRNGQQRTATVSLEGADAHMKSIRMITVAVTRDDRVVVRFGLDDGSTFVPNEPAGERKARELAESFENAVIERNDEAALAALRQLASLGRESLNAARPVLVAARHSNRKLAKAALKAGGDVEALGAARKTPLSTAASLGDLELVKLFVAAGAKVNREGISPLLEAAEDGHLEIVRYLLQKGADPNVSIYDQTPLVASIRSRNPAVVRLLLDAGADAKALFAGQSLVDFAKRFRAPEAVVDLLTKGAGQ